MSVAMRKTEKWQKLPGYYVKLQRNCIEMCTQYNMQKMSDPSLETERLRIKHNLESL
jgi:hypothetical protein